MTTRTSFTTTQIETEIHLTVYTLLILYQALLQQIPSISRCDQLHYYHVFLLLSQHNVTVKESSLFISGSYMSVYLKDCGIEPSQKYIEHNPVASNVDNKGIT